jgi:hypothetical protein
MENRKVKTGPFWGLVPVVGGGYKEAGYGGNITYPYKNGKMRPVETMGGGEIKENDVGHEFD